MDKSAHEEAAETANDALYELQGIAAVYTPAGETAKNVTLLVENRGRLSQTKQGVRTTAHTLRAMVRTSEVEELGRGDTFRLSGESIDFRVIPGSVTNDGLEWDFEASAEVTKTLGNVDAVPDR